MTDFSLRKYIKHIIIWTILAPLNNKILGVENMMGELYSNHLSSFLLFTLQITTNDVFLCILFFTCRLTEANASHLYLLFVPSAIRIPPANVTAHNTSSTSIMVQWQPPALPVGVKLSGYEVFFKPLLNASAQWDTAIACNSTSNVTLKGLQKYTEYEIKVSAFNILGPGNFSEVVTSFTDEDSEWKVGRFCFFV